MGCDAGERIIRHREKAGVTQDRLADVLNVARSTLSKWESGTNMIPSDQLVNIARFFGITTDELLTGVKAQNTEIHKATGLSDSAIEALRSFRDNDTIEALNKALSNTVFLCCVASLMDIEVAASGYYDGCSHSPGEPFYKAELSPDSYAAYLSVRLVQTITAIRENRGIPGYPPAERRIAEMTEQLRREGILHEAPEE